MSNESLCGAVFRGKWEVVNVKGVMPMKTVIFCVLMMFAVPISGKAAILGNHMAGKSQNPVAGELQVQLCQNSNNEDDPATDDGEDQRDGDSDSNSNDDSDKDNG